MGHSTSSDEHCIKIFVQVYYLDVWQEISELLAQRVSIPFDLIVSTSHSEDAIARPCSVYLRSWTVLRVENRGRDILPFMHALAAAGDFEFGVKLHTKKSPQRIDGSRWRAEIFDSLLPPSSGDRNIVAKLRADPRIGFVAPAGFCLSVRPWILVNAPGMERVMTAMGHRLTDLDFNDAFFAAGSMFWFRKSALASFGNLELATLFEQEKNQLDGTAAHAVERLFPVEAGRQGFLSLAMPALMASTPEMPTVALREIARSHADIPSTYFPAPYVEALPARPRKKAQTARRRKFGNGYVAIIYRRMVPRRVRILLRRLLGRSTD